MNEVVQLEHSSLRNNSTNERPGPQSLWIIATDLRENPDASCRRCDERYGIDSPSIPSRLGIRMHQHEALRCGQRRRELEGGIPEPAVRIDRHPVAIIRKPAPEDVAMLKITMHDTAIRRTEEVVAQLLREHANIPW